MNKPLTSRLTSKGQATIPVEVRKVLRLKEGDSVLFEMQKGKVTLRRAEALDRAFLKLAETAFEEWNSPEDEAAFRDL
ncbi:MAG: AbrB/MazE/SpoVT family DNA-binding domain-containing protein [Proteobacteria bacterium]|jgi:AbrB family looped-hinge helix DNA binding protein|nr:AbrB/MazE/SpoVT family DNA-binding domain-containing protein [Pseudomonadota bacterium]